MGTFRPIFGTKYTEPPPLDPTQYPAPDNVNGLAFGELFHTIYNYAVNLYDVAKHGPGSHRSTMEAITNLVIELLIGMAAWVDGQAAAPPSPGLLRAKLQDIRTQAMRYSVQHPEDSISHYTASVNSWFIPRVQLLHDKAYELKAELRQGTSRVRLVAEFEVDLEVKPADAKEYIQGMICKEYFATETLRFMRLKKIDVLTDETTPETEED